jgi:two-component system, OmpR family, sensor histidine kinase KdpD
LLDAALEHVAGDVGRFELSIEPRLPNLLVDPAQLERALANLFDNARRYAEGVPVEVSAHAEQGRLRVRVTDRGPGIPPEEREKVFEPFYRGEAPGAHGSGLGLAIVKGFVELNGGRVFVEPAKPGPGSTFVIELRIEAEHGDQYPAS